jgi:CRP-like cAMP-binding protein
MISPSLATKVSVMIFSSSIQKSSMFRKIFQNKQKLMQSQMESGNSQKIDNQEIVSLMIEKFQTKLVEPENVICQ